MGKGENMFIDINSVQEFINLGLRQTALSELETKKAIASQLEDSRDWLNNQAEKTVDYDQKAQLLKEATAADRELSAIRKEISKLETNNE